MGEATSPVNIQDPMATDPEKSVASEPSQNDKPQEKHEGKAQDTPEVNASQQENYLTGSRLYIITLAFTMSGLMLTIDGSILCR